MLSTLLLSWLVADVVSFLLLVGLLVVGKVQSSNDASEDNSEGFRRIV